MKKLLLYIWKYLLSFFGVGASIILIPAKQTAIPYEKAEEGPIFRDKKKSFFFRNNRKVTKGRVFQVIYLKNGCTKLIKHTC